MSRSGLADYQGSSSARRSSRRSQRQGFSHGLLVGELIGLWILLAQAIPNLTASDANARASRSCITSNPRPAAAASALHSIFVLSLPFFFLSQLFSTVYGKEPPSLRSSSH